MKPIDRRLFLLGGVASALAACDRLPTARVRDTALQAGEDATKFVQRLLLTPQSLAHEFPESAISAHFKANGTTDPAEADYKRLVTEKFASWRLKVSGLVEHPLELSLDDLRALPARTQITRHDCVEGWSSIGKWTGAPLATVLQKAGLKPQARYVVFRCFDAMEPNGLDPESSRYYESLDLVDAFHPQTILAYDMNGSALGVPHGAPLRVRVERQLGYKMAKYLRAIEVVEGYGDLYGGRGGYWEDQGYDWYAGL